MNEQELDNYCKWVLVNFPNLDCDSYKLKMSFGVLDHFMGRKWTQKVISPKENLDNSRAIQQAIKFLRTEEWGFQAQERISKMAIRLFNLQTVPNLDKVIRQIVEGDLEGGYGELEAGDLFFRKGIPFSFVIPCGTKTLDFDIRIERFNVNCEVKHKIEENQASKEALERTLSDAKAQVPSGEKSLFFIKIPINWVQDENMKTIVDRVNGTFFPRSENVIGYILHWERPIENTPGHFVWEYRFELNQAQEINSRDITEQLTAETDLVDSFTRAIQRNISKCSNYGVPVV